MVKPAVPPGPERSENSPLPSVAGHQTDWTDDAILDDFLATGSQEAFAQIASRHGAMVFRTCLRRLGNVHDAEDAAQAVFLQLARTPARAKGSLGGWLHKVAGDTAITLLRTRARRARREEEAAMRKTHSEPTPSEEPLREELDRGIARLPTRLRDAVILCYLEGHKQEEAARILGCNQGTLSRWANDGLEQLRALLGKRGVAVTSVALVGFFAQQKATAAVPAGLLGSLGLAGTGKAAVGAHAAALADAVGRATLVAKAKLAAAVVLTAAVAGSVVALRPAAESPREAVAFLAFDGASPPLTRNGEKFPRPYHEPGNTDPGGLFTTSIEPADAVAGHSLRMRLTQGRFKAQFRPEGVGGRINFARAYAADPAKWRFNTYNRFRLWIKLPTSARPHSTTGGSNMSLGTYVKHVRGADEYSLDAGGGSYGHRFNVPVAARWAQVIFNTHPSFGPGDSESGDLPHPTGEPDYNYFDAMTQFSIEDREVPAKYPADYLLDEMEFYREPRPENDEQVSSIVAVHVPAEDRVVVTWNRRLGEDAIAHEVRYAFEDIHRLGWKQAIAAPGGMIRPPGKGRLANMVYDARALPLAGRSLLYLAIKPQNSEVFSQVVIPLHLPR